MDEVEALKREIEQLRADSAKVVYALDRSCQLIDALIAWLPHGQVESPNLSAAHGAWREAMRQIGTFR